MFQIGDYVYYASGGICQVAEICYAPLSGMPKDRLYYVLRSMHEASGVMYVPVYSDTVFLRPLLTKDAAERLLDQFAAIGEIEESNAKLLKGKYIEAMNCHDPTEWVRVIKTVRRRIRNLAEHSKTQRISDTERSYAEDAKRYLYTELSLILEIPVGEMEGYIQRRAEKMA